MTDPFEPFDLDVTPASIAADLAAAAESGTVTGVVCIVVQEFPDDADSQHHAVWSCGLTGVEIMGVCMHTAVHQSVTGIDALDDSE